MITFLKKLTSRFLISASFLGFVVCGATTAVFFDEAGTPPVNVDSLLLRGAKPGEGLHITTTDLVIIFPSPKLEGLALLMETGLQPTFADLVAITVEAVFKTPTGWWIAPMLIEFRGRADTTSSVLIVGRETIEFGGLTNGDIRTALGLAGDVMVGLGRIWRCLCSDGKF